MEMMTVRSVADVPKIKADERKPEMKTLSRFTDAERQEIEHGLNAVPTDSEIRGATGQSSPQPHLDDWRFINAQHGRCRRCQRTFEPGEVMVWNTHTHEQLHPSCCAQKYGLGLMRQPQPGGRRQDHPKSSWSVRR
jgi:hypothetical protein